MGDLFDKLNLSSKLETFNKAEDISDIRSAEFNLPLVNAKHGNNGIMYYGRESDWESAEMTIDIVNDGAVSTGDVYPQPQKTGVLYNAYLIKPKFSTTVHSLYFMSVAIQKAIKHKFSYEYKASWDRVSKEKILLPTKNNAIDFDFMEEFIAEIEAERVAEIEAYLTAAGLKDTELTAEEAAALVRDDVEWREYKIPQIFDVFNTKSIIQSNITPNSGNIPYVTASSNNNGIMTYINCNKNWIDKGNCIMIGGKTLTFTYQSDDFCSNDSHNLALYLKNEEKATKKIMLFLIGCLQSSLNNKYTWGNSISKQKIQDDTIFLPTKNNSIDFDFMEHFIRAIEKEIIRGVVKFGEKKSAAYREVVRS